METLTGGGDEPINPSSNPLYRVHKVLGLQKPEFEGPFDRLWAMHCF